MTTGSDDRACRASRTEWPGRAGATSPRSGPGMVLLLLVVAAALVVACSDDEGADPDPSDDTGGAEAEAEPAPGGTLRFGLAAETSGWNPSVDQLTLSGYQVTRAMYDVLVAYDEDRQWRAYLAEDVVPNEDFTEWTFTLRDGVEFHDGTTFDADALAANLRATKDSPILGQVFQPVADIAVVDGRTVAVAMSEPWSTFPDTLTAQPGQMVAPSMLDTPGADPVGTGPFRFVSWERDSNLVVERNDRYWRDGYPLLDGIEFRILTDPAARAATFEAGDVDIFEVRDGPTIVDYEARVGNGDVQVLLDESGETTERTLFLNTAVPPFDHPAAREAVAHAIDREVVADVVYAGRFPVANGPFKPDSPWNRGVEFPAFDPERAAEAAVEYEADTGAPLQLEFLVTAGRDDQRLGSLVQQMLAEVDVSVELRQAEASQAILDSLLGSYEMATADALWGSTHPDREHTFISGANSLPPGQLATNLVRFADDRIDDALDRARATDDPDGQQEAWGDVQEALAEANAWLYLTHIEVGDVARPEVRDLTTWSLPDGTPGLPQAQNVLSVYQVWIDD